MNSLRVLLVTRRFWPLVGESEWLTTELAARMRALGAQPTIVTAQWQPEWPTAAVLREVPIVRLSQPSAGGWGKFRYLRTLARWIRKQSGQYDVVYVSGLRHDAYAALGTKTYSPAPVVLRAEADGDAGDCRWLQTKRQGRGCLHRCRTAERIVATNSTVESELLSTGFGRQQIERISLAVEPAGGIGHGAKATARAALHNVNPDLMVPEQGCVALTVCRLHRVHKLELMIKSWRRVTQALPNAKLWIVGDGPQREDLYEQIVQLGLRQDIFLPGSFDDIDELVRAADVYVMPPNGSTIGFVTLKAMMARLPIVANGIESNADWVLSYADSNELAHRLTQLFRDPNELAKRGRLAQQNAERTSMKEFAENHLNLFEQLISQRRAKAS